jgi:FlaA1/EpsC-like NDP-sugar epimerase/tetratricopeptide (TPR) repeat protein
MDLVSADDFSDDARGSLGRLGSYTPEQGWEEELAKERTAEQRTGAALALGRLAAAEGRLDQAVVFLREAAEGDEGIEVATVSSRAWVHLVPILEELGRDVEAEQALLTAQAGSDPEHTPDVSLDVAAIFVRRDQPERAIEVLKSVVDAWPDREQPSDDDADMARAVAALRLGNLQAGDGDTGAAAASWRRAMDTNHPAVTPLAALCLADAARAEDIGGSNRPPAEIEELYRIAIDFNHAVAGPEAALRLADYLVTQEQPKLAAAEYRAVIGVGGEIGSKAQERLTGLQFRSPPSNPRAKLVHAASNWAREAVNQGSRRAHRSRRRRRRVLIVGAGTGGKYLLRDLDRNRHDVVGLIDDGQIGATVDGVPVLGGIDDLAGILDLLNPDFVHIAIPTMSGERRGKAVDAAMARGIGVKNLPTMFELMRTRNLARQLRDVRIEETMGRNPMVIDRGAGEIVRSRNVMVTGAGSTMVEELCRQIAHARARHLAIVASSTTALQRIVAELRLDREFERAFPVLGPCERPETMGCALGVHRPEIVFHVAGHSQAVVAEENPVESIRTDVLGTWELAHLCGRYGVKRFVFVSSEDAAAPHTVFGASKLLAEQSLRAVAHEFPQTEFLSVRVGNLYRSSGSVVEVFDRQIELGGPVTLTDGEASRRFMRSQLATQLLLRTAALSGPLYALAGKEEVRIADLAARMIALRGFDPGEIEIANVGARVGEPTRRLPYNSPRERPAPTEIPEVLAIKYQPPPTDAVVETLKQVRTAVEDGDPARLLHLFVPAVADLVERPAEQTLEPSASENAD